MAFVLSHPISSCNGSLESSQDKQLENSEGVLTTPDGRYIVVRRRPSGTSSPHQPEDERQHLVSELRSARRAVKGAADDPDLLRVARKAVYAAKVALGERGLLWWMDGSPT